MHYGLKELKRTGSEFWANVGSASVTSSATGVHADLCHCDSALSMFGQEGDNLRPQSGLLLRVQMRHKRALFEKRRLGGLVDLHLILDAQQHRDES